MRRLPLFQVDAFSETPFGGNPAAVCPLPAWPDDALMQAIATENNLSETAFFVAEGNDYGLRWFTPAAEVDLCGHATLASAHVLFHHMGRQDNAVRFHTRSGWLGVERKAEMLVMDFPALENRALEAPSELTAWLDRSPFAVFSGQDLIVVLEDEASIRKLRPDPLVLRALPCRGVAFTAPGEHCDFVSRAFYPRLSIPEDPVTGSVHCQLVPYWADRLGRTCLLARQLSPRGGELHCERVGNRVKLGGHAVTFMEGSILLDLPENIPADKTECP